METRKRTLYYYTKMIISIQHSINCHDKLLAPLLPSKLQYYMHYIPFQNCYGLLSWLPDKEKTWIWGWRNRELSIDNTSQRYDCLCPGWCSGGEKGWHTPFTTNLTMEQGPANMLLGHDLTALLLELSDCYAHWMALYEALVWL